MSTAPLKYRRILLKLSGEALMGDEDYGIDPKVIERLAREVIEAQQASREPLNEAELIHSKRVDTNESASLDSLITRIRQRLPGL